MATRNTNPKLLALAAILVFATAIPAHGQSDDDLEKHLIVTADLNRDGIPDRAEATPSQLLVSMGQPNGTFRQASAKAVLGSEPRDIVAGDFNKDGNTDLIVGDGDGALTLFLGDGAGNLTPAGNIAHFDSVVSIAVADFNHDGIPDLAVSDAHASNITILLGTNSGKFQSGWSSPLRMMGTSPHVAAADFNGDGILDLAIVYDSDDGDTFDVMLGNGAGAFTPAPLLSRVRDPNAHCVT
ncbi:FG-GAP repeat domain-containing protein [Granulicella arctica]|uniref:FG-GAP repeat domain-containing protein n=1 Tax=Granulicella arctica TaxID=940613 RepID=UPI0021DF4C2C|nr:VCBS repeat-containing protein [Granulicella arctica]